MQSVAELYSVGKGTTALTLGTKEHRDKTLSNMGWSGINPGPPT